jgi:DNA helicase II / ATP-dependent DNA helicase PcrA
MSLWYLRPVPEARPIYSDEQQALIDDPCKALLVAAPAGAGKTRVLVGKAQQLMESGVPSDRLCILTFTKKSAQDIKLRLANELYSAAEQVVCHTFHAFALECLRVDSGSLALGTDFSVLSPAKASQLLGRVVADLSPDANLSDGDAFKLYRELSASINRNESIEDRLERLPFVVSGEDVAPWLDAYVETKLSMRVLDYDDLLFMFTFLLETEVQYRQRFSERFVHVLVDEYQDVNDLQARMIALLSSHHGRIFAIGDHAQSIYGFRGANVRHFRSFVQAYPGAQIRHLHTNYRSTQTIVQAAETLLRQDQYFAGRSVQSAREVGEPIALVGCETVESEAGFIASEIEDLMSRGVAPSQIAVLVRLKHQAQQIELMLKARGVPLNVKVGRSFMDRPHVKGALALIRLTQEPNHAPSWLHLFGYVKGFGPVLSARACQFVLGETDTVGSSDQSRRARRFEQSVLEGLERFKKRPEDLFKVWSGLTAIDDADCSDEVDQDLSGLARLWVTQTHFTGLTDELNFMNGIDELGEVESERVTLLSIHQSKGLEWHSVFVPGVNEGTVPVFSAARHKDGLEEERRLLYVAATRARDRLYICCKAESADSLSQLGTHKSRFVEVLLQDDPSLFEGVWVSGQCQ